MSKSGKHITLILGPGNHQEKLIDAIKETGYSFEVFNYFPKFTVTSYDSRKKVIFTRTNEFYSFLVKVIWAIFVRINFLKKTNAHVYLSNCIYDYWVSKNISKTSKLLWAWSQVSLITISSFKNNNLPVILETPMIHINEWVQILDKEYRIYSQGQYRYYEICKPLNTKMKKEYKLADTIVVLSEFALQSFLKNKIDKSKLSKVSLYAYPEGINQGSKSTESSNYEILFVGRIDVLKGIPRLLKVIDKIAINKKNVRITLVGEIKDEVFYLFKKKRPYLKVIGYKTKEELINIYRTADLLILPSVQESFGLVILEALSCGLKVLASINSGAPDIAKFSDNVTLFNPFDEEELKEKILSSINNKRINEYSDLSMFSKENYNAQIGELIDKYLNIL